MKILFIGATSMSTTSRFQADALTRIGHEVYMVDPYSAQSSQLQNRLLSGIHYRTGYRYLQKDVLAWTKEVLSKVGTFDLVWVAGGELLGRKSLLELKEAHAPMILYNHDDPTGTRDGARFASLLDAVDLYDLVAAVRDDSEKELAKYCVRKVLRTWRTYDEIQHNADLSDHPLPVQYLADISFVGTWMRNEHRDMFLLSLASKGLNVSIWGSRWQKSPYWKNIRKYWRGGALAGKDYVMAIRGAKICLGLLSKGNRDLHTTRSMEIPYAGGLLCAERTIEHLQLYREDEEAIFWSDAEECAEKCIDILAHPAKRERIRLAGMRRVRKNKVGNEDICRQIISAVFQ